MTILWCGGEDVDFYSSSAFSLSNLYRADFARSTILCAGSSSIYSGIFPQSASLWLSWRMQVYQPPANNAAFGIIKSGTTNKGIFFGTGGSSYKAGIWKYNGTAWSLIASEAGTSLTGNQYPVKFDLQISDFGENSTIKLYFNNTLLIDSQVDSSIQDVSNLDQIAIIYNGTYLREYSEIIVADEDTRLMSLKTHYPTAAGDASNWSGSYADIDEASNSDNDLIYSGTANAEFQCNLSNLPSGNYQIKAVKVAARQNNNTGFGTQIGIKTNDTVNLAAAQQSVGTWGTKEVLYQVNPVTGQPFTMDEVNALQFAAKHVAV